MQTTSGTITVHDALDLRRLGISHPGHGNSLDTSALIALIAALQPLGASASAWGTRPPPLVIEGENGCFSAGHDLNELAHFDATAALAYSHLAHQATTAVEHWPGVTIAVVRGACMGPGLELALACDLLIATPGARFGLPGLAFGLMPVAGGLRRMSARCSAEFVRELFLIGRILKAGDGHHAGLVDRVVSSTASPERIAQRWGPWDSSAVAAIRSLRLRRQGHPEVALEADLFAAGFATGDIQQRLSRL